MDPQIQKDREFVTHLIADREKYQPTFVRRFREMIFMIIDGTNQKIGPTATLSIEQKKSILNAFLDYLYNKDARILADFLNPKRLNIDKKGKYKDNKYSLVPSSQILGNMPKVDEEGIPFLHTWVYEQSCIFIRTKILVNGVVERNEKVISAFISKEGPLSCFPIISGMVWDYKGKTLMQDVDVAQELAIALLQDEHIRNKFKDYRYEIEFYSYFKSNIFEGFFRKICLKKIDNPIYFSSKNRENLEMQEIERLSIELGKSEEDILKILENEKKKRKYHFKGDHYTIAPFKVIKGNLTDEINDNLLTPSEYNDSSSIKYDEEHYQYLIERVFRKMSQTPAGRKQVEILRVLQINQSSEIKKKDKEIAEYFGMSAPNFSKEKTKAQKAAKQEAKKLGIAHELGLTLDS